MTKFNMASIRSLSLFCAMVVLVCGSLSLFCTMTVNTAEASSLPGHHAHDSSNTEGECFDSLVSSLSAWETDMERVFWKTIPLSFIPVPATHDLEIHSREFLHFERPPRYLLISTFLI